MSRLFSLKQERHEALTAVEGLIAKAEAENRSNLTEAENKIADEHLARVKTLNPQIERIENANTLVYGNGTGVSTIAFPNRRGALPTAKNSTEGPLVGNSKMQEPRTMFSSEYMNDFHSWIASGGQNASAALYEGSNPAGGFAVPTIVDGTIVPLAPQEMAVRRLAKVIPTASDIKIPRKGAFGTAAVKPESGSTTNTFVESDPTLEQFTLSAFTVGNKSTISWELAQDVQQFQSFAVDDLISAIQQFEEGKFINGSGTGEPQGLLGNVGAGVTGVTNTASALLDATFDVQSNLNALYHPGAAFLMSRSTGVALKKAQKQANLFEPVFTRENGQDYLHGYPVFYSASMPTLALSATPIMFGDFAQGYVIGDRGGAGISIKILDQPLATQGQIVLLGYRRTDWRVRRSEAIQAITIAAS